MSKSDLEMEDAEKLSHELGDNVQDPECCESDIESKGETGLSQADDMQGNANKNENEGKDVNNVNESQCKPLVESKGEAVLPEADIQGNDNKDVNTLTDDAHDKVTLNSEVEDQSHPSGEAVEPMVDVTPIAEPINDTSENVGLINAETNGDEPTAGGSSTVEEHTDTGNEHDKQSTMDTDNGLERESHVNNIEKQTETENPQRSISQNLESGNHLEDVEEKSSADIVEKVSEEIKKPDQDSVEHLAREESTVETDDAGNEPSVKSLLSADISDNKAAENESRLPDEIPLVDNKESENAADSDEKKAVIDEIEEPGNEMSVSSPVTNKKAYAIESETSAKHGNDDSSRPYQQEPATRSSRVRYSPSKNGNQAAHAVKTVFTQAALPLMVESDDGTPEEQSAFMKELEAFYRERGMDFKPPKFYGKPLNCLKLWRSVIRLGCYDRVTGSKLWRQVGESFHPPKTCTTVSFTFRVFYEKSLLEFERHKKQRGELQLPLTSLHDESGVDNEGYGNNQGSGSVTVRARRDAAARAMQGWHVQRVLDNGEVGQPVIKDKYPNDTAKREKNLRSIGPIKQKRPNEVENSIKVARTDAYNQLETTVVDIGPPADWVKINIRQTKDCFEVYALVPGLLREEVRVQSDPAGRLVITGHPEQVDNPWGITPFKKVVSLPARIDPLQTSAIVSLHGRLFIRVPFEQSNV